MFQIASEDADVRPFATLEWAIYPTDVAGLNVDANLVPKSGTLVFVAAPCLAEWRWLQNREVSAINCHLASPSLVAAKTILHLNLSKQQRVLDNKL